MIKFTTRPNMKYLVQLIIGGFLLDVILDVINLVFKFIIDLIYVLLPFLGNIIFGLVIYLYQKNIQEKKAQEKILLLCRYN